MDITHHHPTALSPQERAEQLYGLSRACLLAVHQGTLHARTWRVNGSPLGTR